ncbi:MAG: hypothetical protein JKY56_16220 [Kofleriaceae bacterium]|nr:hypothetical protein [Kofleriaceae bacterium]
MGFLDKMKKKAQSAIGQVPQVPQVPQAPQVPQNYAQPQVPQAAAAQNYAQAQVPQAAAPVGGFHYNGEHFPMPQGWDGLSIEDWFFKLESVRERLMHIDDEVMPPMTDEDGDVLDAEEVLLITQYGFQHAGHWENFRNWGAANWAAQTGETPTDCEFRMSGIARERIIADKATAMSGPGGVLSPVEGVSCEQWAHVQAGVASGGDHASLVAAAGMDAPMWDRVNAEWTARMSTETSGTIATVYSTAFAAGSSGQYSGAAAQAAVVGVGGDVGAEPVSFERFVELTEAQGAASTRGEDPIAVLASFGMSPMDWSNIGQYWAKKQQQEATKYYELYNQYSAVYAAKYGNGDGMTNDQREVKIVNDILNMAGSGQTAQIIPFLQEYFPEDAQDMCVLDGWLDRACDKCVETGDQGRAQQILWMRHGLQDDVDEPVAEWVQSELESLF